MGDGELLIKKKKNETKSLLIVEGSKNTKVIAYTAPETKLGSRKHAHYAVLLVAMIGTERSFSKSNWNKNTFERYWSTMLFTSHGLQYTHRNFELRQKLGDKSLCALRGLRVFPIALIITIHNVKAKCA